MSERYAALQLIDDLTAARAWLSLLARRRDIPPGAQMMASQALAAVERAATHLRETRSDGDRPDDTRVPGTRTGRRRRAASRSESDLGVGTAGPTLLHSHRIESPVVQIAN